MLPILSIRQRNLLLGLTLLPYRKKIAYSMGRIWSNHEFFIQIVIKYLLFINYQFSNDCKSAKNLILLNLDIVTNHSNKLDREPGMISYFFSDSYLWNKCKSIKDKMYRTYLKVPAFLFFFNCNFLYLLIHFDKPFQLIHKPLLCTIFIWCLMYLFDVL